MALSPVSQPNLPCTVSGRGWRSRYWVCNW
ncbi:Uncharacterised protein [Bordetella pertussis]|nr:Uncharacterised protein [Bordetella pertussis]